ncbi:MAG TPA: response regulator transcription factor, partial [Thermoanaerobaculia bacterium]
MTPSARILVAEDDLDIRRAIVAELRGEGYETAEAADGREALTMIRTAKPDLVLTDLAMPVMDGFALIAAVRKRGTTPIIVLSVRGGEADRVRALDLGADDFVAKPFSVAELFARIRALLRRTGLAAAPRLAFPGLTVDFERRRVLRDDREIRLTPIEFALLSLLASNA